MISNKKCVIGGLFEKAICFLNKTKKRKIIVALLACVLALSLMAIVAVTSVSGAVKKRTADRVITLDKSDEVYGIDCIVVLGCYVRSNGTPSDMLRDRLDTALALFNAGVSEKIIVSGDHGKSDYNEVGVMKKYLVDNGVPSENIFMDHAGFSTYDTVCRTKEIFLADSYYKRVIFVTQEYHLYRSLYIAESVGLDAYGVPADLHAYSGQSKRDVRESLARFKDFFSCYLEVRPKYLGDKISLNESGDITNDSYYEALLSSSVNGNG